MDALPHTAPPLRTLLATLVPRPERTRLKRVERLLLVGFAASYTVTIAVGSLGIAVARWKAAVVPVVVVAYLAGSVLLLLAGGLFLVRAGGQVLKPNRTLADHLERQISAEDAVTELLVQSSSILALKKLDRRIDLEVKLSERLIVTLTSASLLLPTTASVANMLAGSAFNLGETVKLMVPTLLLGFVLGRLLRADFIDRLLKLQLAAKEAVRFIEARSASSSVTADREAALALNGRTSQPLVGQVTKNPSS